jgi:hypothetical protein
VVELHTLEPAVHFKNCRLSPHLIINKGTTMPTTSKSKAASEADQPGPILRFAHPYVTPAEKKSAAAAGGGLIKHIATKICPIPKARTDEPMPLSAIIGQQASDEIAQSGKIFFHVGGDSGVPDILDRETRQTMVADAMTQDYNLSDHTKCPAFLYHLGDVLYTKAGGTYDSEFYKPYKHYPGKIVAIPGNHDGETPEKMKEFQATFCARTQTVPPDAGVIFRQTMTQPGVYWLLDAPFVQIVGLYSNCAENPGFISGAIPGGHQKAWLIKTLKAIAAARKNGARKALLFTTHHPPFASGGHSGSSAMLADIDDACDQAGGIYPDVFLSGHAHSIQRYTRTKKVNGVTRKIPHLIYGCIGHGGQAIGLNFPSVNGDVSYDFAYKGYGYGLITATKQSVTLNSFGVDWDANNQAKKTPVDKPIIVQLI